MVERDVTYSGHSLYMFSVETLTEAFSRFEALARRKFMHDSASQFPDTVLTEEDLEGATRYSVLRTHSGSVSQSYEDVDSFYAAVRDENTDRIEVVLHSASLTYKLFLDLNRTSNYVSVQAHNTSELDRLHDPFVAARDEWAPKFEEWSRQYEADEERRRQEERGGSVQRFGKILAKASKHPLVVNILAAVIGAVAGSAVTYFLTTSR